MQKQLVDNHSSDALPAWVREVMLQLGLLQAAVVDVRNIVLGRQKPYVSVREAAEQAGRSEYTIRRWISEQKLRATKVNGTGPNGRLLVFREDLDRLLQGGLGAAPSMESEIPLNALRDDSALATRSSEKETGL